MTVIYTAAPFSCSNTSARAFFFAEDDRISLLGLSFDLLFLLPYIHTAVRVNATRLHTNKRAEIFLIRFCTFFFFSVVFFSFFFSTRLSSVGCGTAPAGFFWLLNHKNKYRVSTLRALARRANPKEKEQERKQQHVSRSVVFPLDHRRVHEKRRCCFCSSNKKWKTSA